MSLLVTIDTDPNFTPMDAVPGSERLISGNPFFKTWARPASETDIPKFEPSRVQEADDALDLGKLVQSEFPILPTVA